mgnify:CR=1 FL=1
MTRKQLQELRQYIFHAALLGGGVLPRTLEYMDGRCVDALRPVAPFRFPEAIDAAIVAAKQSDLPSMIACKTHIALGHAAQDTSKGHGALTDAEWHSLYQSMDKLVTWTRSSNNENVSVSETRKSA